MSGALESTNLTGRIRPIPLMEKRVIATSVWRPQTQATTER